MRTEIIGDCTLYLGDCLEVLPMIGACSVDVVTTDPPYGINTKSDGSGKLSPWADLCNSSLWYSTWMAEISRILRPSGCMWSFLNWRSMVTFQKASCETRWPIESMLVWNKSWIGPGGCRGLRPSYEMVALWCMEEFAIKDRGIPDIQTFDWSSNKPNGHPAEKPESIFDWLLEISGHPNGVVCDPFMGSGTSMVSARKLGMRGIGVEMDEVFFDIACRRIERAVREASEGLFVQPPSEVQLELGMAK